MTNNTIGFPCAVLFKNGEIAAYAGDYSLSVYGEQFVDRGHLHGCRIIDIHGNVWLIDDVEKIKNVNMLPKYFVRYSKRVIQVKLTYRFIEKLSVGQMKETIIASIQINPKLFSSYKEIGLIQMIKGADDYMETIEAIGIE